MANKIWRMIYYLFAALLSLFIVTSCGSSGSTVIVQSAPISSHKPDTSMASNPSSASFQALTIGENQPIHSLDPLFIKNASEMRAVQLYAEGLVRFDKKGQIIPAMASHWTVSNNHQKYRFILRHKLFYQDSDVFSNGRGRRLTAKDIKKDFERMAKLDVPSHAAHLFMNIRGFEPYFQEQHHVFRRSEQQYKGINGIHVPNDSTVIFLLAHPDAQFLQKLASPYAVIYAPESVKSKNFQAVGTGPFKFFQKRSDSLYIFGRFDNYHGQDQPTLNRVDIVTSSHPMVLLRAMNHGNIDLIPALGPQQMQAAIGNDGKLKESLTNKFRLLKPTDRVATYELEYNSGADLSEEAVAAALSKVQGTSFFSNFPSNAVQLHWSLPNAGSSAPADSLLSNYTSDPFIHSFYTALAKRLSDKGILFKMKQTRVINRNLALHTWRKIPPYEPLQNGSNDTLAALNIKIWALAGKNINNLSFNKFPWWINLRNVTIAPTDSY